jgi:hypothetical protein
VTIAVLSEKNDFMASHDGTAGSIRIDGVVSQRTTLFLFYPTLLKSI